MRLFIVRADDSWSTDPWYLYETEANADSAIDFLGSGVGKMPEESTLDLCGSVADILGLNPSDKPGTCYEINVTVGDKWLPALKRRDK